MLGAQTKKALINQGLFRLCFGRSDRIRTCDPCVPNAVLYQAELHSDIVKRTSDSSQQQRASIVAELFYNLKPQAALSLLLRALPHVQHALWHALMNRYYGSLQVQQESLHAHLLRSPSAHKQPAPAYRAE
jgi:hypothetical protein